MPHKSAPRVIAAAMRHKKDPLPPRPRRGQPASHSPSPPESVSPDATIHRVNLHTTYDVAWTPMMIARDLMQNFYDSVPRERFIHDIQVHWDPTARTVTMQGPGLFDPAYLWRIGLTTKRGKEDRYAGGFGEGFAIAVLQILRDRLATVATIVGNRILRFSLDPITVGTETVYELICHDAIVPPDQAIAGTRLILREVITEFGDCCHRSPDEFEYPTHPWLGSRVGRHIRSEVTVYRSTHTTGAVFYRHQRRAIIDLPLIICCPRPVGRIRKLRDRLELTAKDLQKMYILMTFALLDDEQFIPMVMTLFRPYWKTGHPALTALADYAYLVPGLSATSFPADHCARTHGAQDWEAKQAGFTLCAPTMARLGMTTAKEIANKQHQGEYRAPHPREQAQIDILTAVLIRLWPGPAPNRHYHIFEPTDPTKPLEGTFRKGKLILRHTIFHQSFGHAVSIFCRAACYRDYETCPAQVSDTLTEILKRLVQFRHHLGDAEAQWTALQALPITPEPSAPSPHQSPIPRTADPDAREDHPTPSDIS